MQRKNEFRIYITPTDAAEKGAKGNAGTQDRAGKKNKA
jgi:hypothetical protein